MRKNSSSFWKTKNFLVLVLVLLLLGIAGFTLAQNGGGFWGDHITPSAGDQEKVNLDPPIEEEKHTGDKQKEEISKEESKPTAPNDSEKQKATPVFGFLRQTEDKHIEANGYIAETIEDDGICTLTLEKNGQKVAKSKQAMPDAQSTVCGLIIIKRDDLSTGNWKATIAYSSSRYQGVSEERIVSVE